MTSEQIAKFGTTIRTLTKLNDHVESIVWFVAANTPNYDTLLGSEIESEDHQRRRTTLKPIEFLDIHHQS